MGNVVFWPYWFIYLVIYLFHLFIYLFLILAVSVLHRQPALVSSFYAQLHTNSSTFIALKQTDWHTSIQRTVKKQTKKAQPWNAHLHTIIPTLMLTHFLTPSHAILQHTVMLHPLLWMSVLAWKFDLSS